MKNESLSLIDDLLCSWHRWADRWTPAAGHGSSAMFTWHKSSRQYDSEYDIAGNSAHQSQMREVDFHVGEMCAAYQTALGLAAKNLATGAAVWRSPRLPSDVDKCREVVTAAKLELLRRLAMGEK